MSLSAHQVLKTYVILTALTTLAASFIWGINTLFLLDAGLSITQAFTANACFTAGQVLFEVPTGVVADTAGRRKSYLLGAATLFVATLLYLWLWHISGPFWSWALVSMSLGLGFAFFSGATEAWLVDALQATRYPGTLEAAFAKGEIAEGAAMLIGTLAGGAIAHISNLGVPYILRSIVLGVTFAVAFKLMHDVGFTPRENASVWQGTREIFKSSIDYGLRNPPVRWLMLAAPFSAGAGIYAFYAMQPYLLELYGSGDAYAIAGLAAAVVGGAQIVGGLIVPYARKTFRRRTSLLLFGSVLSGGALALIGLTANFWLALALLTIWGVVFAAAMPIRQAFINGLIPSAQRATVLSSDNLLGSAGGVVVQPALGKVADVGGYAASYVVGAVCELLALPFILLARRQRAPSDPIHGGSGHAARD